jgi:anti-sigma B factor antagonist
MQGRPETSFEHTIARVDVARVADRPEVCVEGLGLSSQRHGAITVVTVRGELDAVTSREFDEYLATARRDSDRVILDLSAVDFMDTSSLAVIVGNWKKLTARDGVLALVGARYRYTKTLWITGLADRLPRYDTLDEAVAALADGTGDG